MPCARVKRANWLFHRCLAQSNPNIQTRHDIRAEVLTSRSDGRYTGVVGMSRSISFATALVASMLAALASSVAAHADSTYNVRTESGQVRCIVDVGKVDCTHFGGFPQAPRDSDGYLMNGAEATAGGGFRWAVGDVGGGPGFQETVLQYGQTYNLAGWTILPSSQGTRFTNDATGHGMFVSVENVSPF